MSKLAQAIDNTIAWLETDPPDRCTGAPAKSELGCSASVLDPEACSWCALGYLARELEMDTDSTGWIIQQLGPKSRRGLLKDIYRANDDGDLPTVIQNLRILKDLSHD